MIGHAIHRRSFLTLLGASAAAWPLAARAQQRERVRGVGVLQTFSRGEGSVGQARVDAFKKGLAELGWIEGRTLRFEERWGDNDVRRLPALAAELAALSP